MTGPLTTLCERWGSDYFQRAQVGAVEALPLLPVDKSLLCDIGLPTGPKKALHFALRFENVDVCHQPQAVRLLTDSEFERSPFFPLTGHPEIDGRIDLGKCVVLGNAANNYQGQWHMTRFVCLDGVHGGVFWIYRTVLQTRTAYSWFNSSLTQYLQCLCAYKEYRERWGPLFDEFGGADKAIADERFETRAWALHDEFVSQLQSSDPEAYERGFWRCHAANETILLGIG